MNKTGFLLNAILLLSVAACVDVATDEDGEYSTSEEVACLRDGEGGPTHPAPGRLPPTPPAQRQAAPSLPARGQSGGDLSSARVVRSSASGEAAADQAVQTESLASSCTPHEHD